MSDGDRPTIHVVAAFTTDAQGRILMVRKHGSEVFMQPGGKPEPGEEAVDALVRELEEELEVRVDPDDLASWGRFEADAANEPDHHLVADVFALRLDREVVAAAEIAEARWFTREEARALGDRLAPLAGRMLELPEVRTHFRPARFTPIETERLRLRLMTLDDGLVVLPGHASEPLAFDGKAHAATLGEVRRAIALESMDEASFVKGVLARIPPNPPNHHTIVQINEGREVRPSDLRTLEAGANRCAVSTA